ncbi:hypothetical protein BGZ83_006964 [Gryganskiella cystojenkinii]|nr:hypothetical protein BGZ83_006964 [Gryganskiella cystojenkinii]
MTVPIPETTPKKQLFQWGNDSETHAIQVEFDPESGKDVVFLDDIQEVFVGKVFIKHGNDIVLYLKDSHRKLFMPKRIEFKENIVLKVVPAFDISLHSSPSSPTRTTVVLSESSSQQPEEPPSPPAIRTSVTGQLLTEIAELAQAVEEVRDNQHRHHAETVDMMKTAHNWLALILDRANAIFRLTYELHEYPIPRLFVILPSRKSFRNKMNPLVDKYRLYFLCECDISSGDGSWTRPHIHFAKHDGYDLERPTEFFRKYGSYILTLLELLKVSVVAASFAVPHIAGIGQGFAKGIEDITDTAREQLTEKVDQAIDFLKDLPSQEGVDTGNNQSIYYKGEANNIEALEGADLRHLASFLKNRDTTRVLGNLYRLARTDGTIKWVCLDHYREEYKMVDQKHFSEFVAANNGTYHANEGKVEIWLNSRQMAMRFYQQLSKARFVHELEVTLDWYTTLDDFKELKAVMDSLPTVLSLTVDCCNTQSRVRDFVSRGTPSTVLAKVMAGHGLQAFAIVNCGEFLSQIEKVSTTNQLRRIDIGSGIEGRSQVNLLSSLVKKSPSLRHLVVHLPDLLSARGLFMNAKPYSFTGVSILEAQIETGEILMGTVQGNSFSSIDLLAVDSDRDLSVLPFVTRFTTKISKDRNLVHLGPFFRSTQHLTDVDMEIGTDKFFDIRGLLIQSGNKRIRSTYLHDTDKGNSLQSSNIWDPNAVNLDIQDDSVDFVRLFKNFKTVPLSCGANLEITNEMFAMLEQRTRTESRLEKLWINIALLNDKGLEDAIAVIKRSELRHLSVRNPISTVWQPIAAAVADADSVDKCNWRLLKTAIPILNGAHLHVHVPTDQILPFYTQTSQMFSSDSNCQLTLGVDNNYVYFKDIQDSRGAEVSLSTDAIGVPLQMFYEMFGSLPPILGDSIKISKAEVMFLRDVVKPGETNLKRLMIDPALLPYGAKMEILEIIDRLALPEIIVRYELENESFLRDASFHLKNKTELTLICERFEFAHNLMYHMLCGGSACCLSLRSGSHKAVFENIHVPLFRIVDATNGDVKTGPLLLRDVLIPDPGYSKTISTSLASTLRAWVQFFPSHCTTMQIDTVLVKEDGIKAMQLVISKSLALSSLVIRCSSNEKSERAARNQFLTNVEPFLTNSELSVRCHIHEFVEVWTIFESQEKQRPRKKELRLCDGGQKLIITPGYKPDLDLWNQCDPEGEEIVSKVGVGETLLKFGANLVKFKITIPFTENAFMDQLNRAMSIRSRLTCLHVTATHFDQDGCNTLQEIINRSKERLKVLSIMLDYQSTLAPMRAFQILVENRKLLTTMGLSGPNTRFWIQQLIKEVMTRTNLPKLKCLWGEQFGR